MLYCKPRQLDSKGSCSLVQSQKHLNEWFLETVCKALPSWDKLENNIYIYLPLCLHQGRASISLKCTSIVPCVGTSASLWAVLAEKRTKCRWIINAFYAARLHCTFRAEMRSVCFLIYLCWEWNTHFSGKDIQLGLLDDAFVTIRLWYTVVEVQEGESTTH